MGQPLEPRLVFLKESLREHEWRGSLAGFYAKDMSLE
jgi:hypothetical protein